MLWRVIMIPFWVLKKGLGAVFMVVRLALGVLRLVFGRRLLAAAVLVGGFFLGKKFMSDKNGAENK
jgi:hypothetical protein